MSCLFWGYFFLFLDFNLNVTTEAGGKTLGLLPDWVGYACLFFAMRQLGKYNSRFKSAKYWCVGLFIYTLITWCMDLFDSTTWLGWGLGLAAVAAAIYVTWLILKGLEELEKKRHTNLYIKTLWTRWKVQVIAMAAIYVLMLFTTPALTLGCIVLSFAAAIGFLLALRKTTDTARQMGL